MNLLHTSLYHIEHSENRVSEVNIDSKSIELQEYVQRLIEEVSTSIRRRRFKFHDDKTQIRASLNEILKGNYSQVIQSNAERLLRIEIDVNDRYGHLKGGIQKGSLFHAHVKNDKTDTIIICKADHNEFLDEDDFKIHKGLPWKDKVFKAILIQTQKGVINDVYVFDTNTNISKYWWSSYLELVPLYSDEHNTEKSIDMILKKVINPIRKSSPRDYLTLRNSTIGFFRSKSEFDIIEYEDFIKDYTPFDEDGFNKEKVLEGISDLPERWKFDNRFSIDKKSIKKRLINETIKLTDGIGLELNDFIEELNNTITVEEKNGEKFVKIKSDKGYEYFKKEGYKNGQSN